MSSDSEPKSALDRSTLLPILLGVVSLFGIIVVLLLGRFNASRNPAPAPETATPFKYLLIGTEPGISTAETATEPGELSDPLGISDSPVLVATAGQGKPQPSSTPSSIPSSNSSSGAGSAATKTKSPFLPTSSSGSATDPIIVLNPGTKKPTATPFPVIFFTHTSTRTPGPTITVTPSRTKRATSTPITPCPSTGLSTPTVYLPLIAATFDNDYLMLDYKSGWSCLVVPSAYQSTLHVSNTIGSTLNFSFIGKELRITFQGNDSLGVLQVNIDGQIMELDQSNGTDEWVSISLAQDTHPVTITHVSGGSVNIDSVIISDQ